MARADANSDDLKSFAKELKKFEATVANQVRQLQARFGSVDWKDSERHKFEAQLGQTLRGVSKSLTAIDPLSKALTKKAAELDRYLGR